MMLDLGKLLNHNFRLLAEAGCKNIQIDEPLFTVARRSGGGCRDRGDQHAPSKGCRQDIHISVHVCQGNYAVGKEYDGQIGHRYFDIGRYKADKICGIECTSLLVEHDMMHHYEGLIGNKQIGVGAVDVQDPKVESGELVAAAHPRLSLAGARADDHHQLLRHEPPAAQDRLRQAEGHDRGQAGAGRLMGACRRPRRPG